MQYVRLVIIALIGMLSATGVLPEEVVTLMEEHVEALVGVIMLTWSLFVWARRHERKP